MVQNNVSKLIDYRYVKNSKNQPMTRNVAVAGLIGSGKSSTLNKLSFMLSGSQDSQDFDTYEMPFLAKKGAASVTTSI